jgi:hypothetical protein
MQMDDSGHAREPQDDKEWKIAKPETAAGRAGEVDDVGVLSPNGYQAFDHASH